MSKILQVLKMTTMGTNTRTSTNNRCSSATLPMSLNLSINYIIVKLTVMETFGKH